MNLSTKTWRPQAAATVAENYAALRSTMPAVEVTQWGDLAVTAHQRTGGKEKATTYKKQYGRKSKLKDA